MKNLQILGPHLTWKVFAEIEHLARQSAEGQALELGWVRDNVCDLTDSDYLRMTLNKTCWYTCIHPCRIGALVACGGEIDEDQFNLFGYYMGAAFQIQDDILNLIGDPKKYGKELYGDIREGKRTLILIQLLNSCTHDEKEYIRSYLAVPRKQRSEKSVNGIYKLIKKYDSIEYARTATRHLAGAALREFYVAYREAPQSVDKDFIYSIVMYMIERDL